jgi:uncharacterized protein (UPF0332 family)
MNARDFLTLAQGLARQSAEAEWRTAVSRAYYAAFHVARDLLEGLGFTVPHADAAHGYLWLRLANSGNPQTVQAGNDLNAPRRDRNVADYELRRTILQGVALSRIGLASDVIRILDAATAEPTRTRITDEMKRYERNVLRNVTWRP